MLQCVGDMGMNRALTDEMEFGHQVCQFHVRYWVERACWDLTQRLPEEWLWMIDKIKQILGELPPDGGQQLLGLSKQLPGHLKCGRERTALDELHFLLIRLNEKWARYTAFSNDLGIPWTHNRTEQAIGGMETRTKTVRGSKPKPGCLMVCWFLVQD